ncbi:hypothetical protein [Allosphingosinicella sp.]|uniref:hypothetical protein n=1 Tax=Allosphingosinicella sp. TaxID=2823234 RepID=UPI002FC12A47
MKIVIGLTALALLAACGQEEGAGGLTTEESQQLNEAAAMLDSAPETLAPADETGLDNEMEPAETGALPVTEEAATNDQ